MVVYPYALLPSSASILRKTGDDLKLGIHIDFENGFKPDDLNWDYGTYGDPKDLFEQLTSAAPANSFVHLEGNQTFPTGILDAPVTEIVSVLHLYLFALHFQARQLKLTVMIVRYVMVTR